MANGSQETQEDKTNNVRTRSACVHPAPGSAISPDLIAAPCVSNHSVSSVCLLVLAGFNQSLFFFLFFSLCCLLQRCVIYIITSTPGKDKKFLFFFWESTQMWAELSGFNKQKPSKGFWNFTSTDLFFKFETAITLPPGGGRVSDTSAQGIAAKYLTAQR